MLTRLNYQELNKLAKVHSCDYIVVDFGHKYEIYDDCDYYEIICRTVSIANNDKKQSVLWENAIVVKPYNFNHYIFGEQMKLKELELKPAFHIFGRLTLEGFPILPPRCKKPRQNTIVQVGKIVNNVQVAQDTTVIQALLDNFVPLEKISQEIWDVMHSITSFNKNDILQFVETYQK